MQSSKFSENKEFRDRLIKRSYKLALNGIKAVEAMPNKRVVWVLSDQFLRSITSVGANIVEAQAASSPKDFVTFLNHSLKSGNETKFWVGLMRDSGYLWINHEAEKLLSELDEICKILGPSIVSLRRRLNDL